MSDEVYFNKMVTKGLEPIESDGRFFEGYLTVQVKDKQGEVTIVDELYKVLPIWMDRGAPITDTHSNRVVGKGINFARAEYKDYDGTIYPAIKVTGKIYNDYELDNEIWKKIKSGEYKGLSFGGSTKTDRQPMRMKDGSIAYSLSKLEHYEVAVCRDPAVPLAVITDTNPIAKSNMNCDNTGCYVTKPILGAPDFESAKRKVMRESDVPEKNAEKIVGAAEAGHLGKGNPNLPYNEEYFKKDVCNDCGLPKIKKVEESGFSGIVPPSEHDFCPFCGEIDRKENLHPCKHCGKDSKDYGWKPKKDKLIKGKIKKGKQVKKKYRPNTECPTCKQIRPDHRYRCPHCGAMGYDVDKADKKKGKQVKERKKRKKQSQGIGNKRGWGAYKSLVATNKILGKYQGNVLKLSRILDKDAPADIKRPSGNIPAKRKEPKGQSHGAQSTRERERGIIEQQFVPWDHYTKPQSMDHDRTLVPHEELGEGLDPDNIRYMRARRPVESMIKPNATLADPRKRKSFTAIQAKIKDITRDMEVNEPLGGKESDEEILSFIRPKRQAGRPRKKKLTKVGSGAMVDPNTSNQGAAFNIRTQTPPKRKKVRTMQAKLGDGTYDYIN